MLKFSIALAGPEFDDSEVHQPARAEGILADDGFDLLTALASRNDDPAVPRYLPPRNQERSRRVVLLQKAHMLRHVRVYLLQIDLVDELYYEHCSNALPRLLPADGCAACAAGI